MMTTKENDGNAVQKETCGEKDCGLSVVYAKWLNEDAMLDSARRLKVFWFDNATRSSMVVAWTRR